MVAAALAFLSTASAAFSSSLPAPAHMLCAAPERPHGMRCGCMSPAATNYDPLAQVHNRLCIYAIHGCTERGKLGFNPLATSTDSSCIERVEGCTHPSASNVNPKATVDDGSCWLTRAGCTRSTAVNYDAFAEHDDGSCRSALLGCMSPLGNNYDSKATIDSGECKYEVQGCMDSTAANYNPVATYPMGDCVSKVLGCMLPTAYNYDPAATKHDHQSCMLQQRPPIHHPHPEYRAALQLRAKGSAQPLRYATGCMDPKADNFVPEATAHTNSCSHKVKGCTKSISTNFNPLATADDGSCRNKQPGCMSPLATGYDSSATEHTFTKCGSFPLRGCTDHAALNFLSSAQLDDGSCIVRREGCTDKLALNFDSRATVIVHRGPLACKYVARGCTSHDAVNFHRAATLDDGSCRFAGCADSHAVTYHSGVHIVDRGQCKYVRQGCKNDRAPNYDPFAQEDDGSCARLGCTQRDAPNHDTSATTYDGSCSPVAGGARRRGGCRDRAALNLDMTAHYNDGSCLFAHRGCAAEDAINFSPYAQIDDGSCLHLGCMQRAALNFNSMANVDDGTCQMPSLPPPPPMRLRIRRKLQQICNSSSSGWAVYFNDTTSSAEEGLAWVDDFQNLQCGCTHSKAENFNPNVQIDDGSCVIRKCMDSNALNFDSEATISGECIHPVMGCTVELADNYDSLATQLDSATTCTFLPKGCMNSFSWNFAPFAVVDDGSCSVTIEGCMDPDASNYNSEALLSVGCYYTGCTDSTALNYVADASIDNGNCVAVVTGCTIEGTHPYLSINYDPVANTYADGMCNFQRVGCTDSTSSNFDSLATYSDDSCTDFPPGCGDPQALNYDEAAAPRYLTNVCTYSVPGCTDSTLGNYNAIANEEDGSCSHFGCVLKDAANHDSVATVDDGSCVRIFGCTDSRADNFKDMAVIDDGSCVIPGCMEPAHPSYASFATVSVSCPALPAGCTSSPASNFVSTAVVDDGSCRYPGCRDSLALNFRAEASFHDGTCEYLVSGCMDSAAGNYVSHALISSQVLQCASPGCTDSEDPNYDATATFDDGSCVLPRRGCMYSQASNYDAAAIVNDGTCVILGCTYSLAPEYNPLATIGDGSCPPISGCTHPAADNYAAYATVDDQSCEILGCTDSRRPFFNPSATVEDNTCGLLVFGCLDSRSESYIEVATGAEPCTFRGCIDSTRPNFNPSATVGDFTCEPLRGGCTTSDARNYQPAAVIDDGSCYVLGCPDSTAANYGSTATVNDGSCVPARTGCMNSVADNYDPMAVAAHPAARCVYLGCTDSTALNFDNSAQYDHGLCKYPPPPPTIPFQPQPFYPLPHAPSPPASCPPLLSPLPQAPPLLAPPPTTTSDGTVDKVVTIGKTSPILGPLLSEYDHFGSSLSLLNGMDAYLHTGLAVGAPGKSVGQFIRVGAIYIVTLNATGAVQTAVEISMYEMQAASSTTVSAALQRYDSFGSAIAQVGHLDADSCQEIAVGASGDNGRTGAVYVLFLQSSETYCAIGVSRSLTSWHKIVPTALAAEDRFGSALAAPGDISADGVPDLIVGAPGAHSGSGAVYLILLNRDGSMQAFVELSRSTGYAPALPDGASFGAAIAIAPITSPARGRILAVGAPEEEGTAGVVYLLKLEAFINMTRPVQSFAPLCAPEGAGVGSAFGQALSYGTDYDGNGTPELLVGAPDAGGQGGVYVLYMNVGGFSAYHRVLVGASSSSVSNFGRALADLGAVNLDDIVSDVAIGARDDLMGEAVGSVGLHFMAASTPLFPAAPPPTSPVDYGGNGSGTQTGSDDLASDGSFSSRDGFLIGLWVIIPILISLLASWLLYFRCMRKHTFAELYKTNYVFGPAESALSAVKQGKITPSCRLELRGSASARKARSVRAMPPSDIEQLTGPRQDGSSAAPMLDPDVLFNMCYAPNVPRVGEMRGSVPFSSPAVPRVVDLSDATESLLRGEHHQQPMSIDYAPTYVQNVPGFVSPPRRGEPSLGGLSAVIEEDRSDTWGRIAGQDRQVTWITDEEQQAQIPAGVLPRSPGTQQVLPSPRESNPALLRI